MNCTRGHKRGRYARAQPRAPSSLMRPWRTTMPATEWREPLTKSFAARTDDGAVNSRHVDAQVQEGASLRGAVDHGERAAAACEEASRLGFFAGALVQPVLSRYAQQAGADAGA